MPQVNPAVETFARIRVIGVGGAGNAAVNRMIDSGVEGVEFISINTDAQALHNSRATKKIHIGQKATRGLGAGADPKVGQDAAEESSEEIKEALSGADMTFIAFGAGGGTGSGAGPIIAKLSRDQGILTVGIATKPFAFEGERRRRNAEEAISRLRSNVDTIITIPNDRLLQTIDRKTPLLDAFKVADDVLRQGVQGISDLITVHGLINLDFADVKAVMSNAGSALMGIGTASGENRAIEAAQMAIESPLLEVSIDGARGVLFNVTGGMDMAMHEINEAAEAITSAVDADANIIFGATMDENIKDEIRVTVIATGFDAAYHLESRRDLSNDGLAYFSKPSSSLDDEDYSSSTGSNESSSSIIDSRVNDDDAASVDIDLESTEKSEQPDIREESEPKTDIWSIDHEEDELDQPAFLRRKKNKKKKKKSDY